MNIEKITIIAFTALLAGCTSQSGEQWYKGNTHTHTLWSDGNGFPEMAADWYKSQGYDFLVLSDHNILSRGEKWKDITRYIKSNDILGRHEARWGKGAVELKTEGGKTLARLKTLEEVRGLLEESGRFILIEGLEITGAAGPDKERKKHLPVHSNAVNVDKPLVPKRKPTVDEEFSHQEDLVADYIAGVDHPVFWHINHPNFKYSNTAEQVARVRSAHGLEVFNASGGCNNQGDERRPGAERIWDIVNTIRLKEYGVQPLFGCGTDDTHNYYTPEDHYHTGEVLRAAPGLAWVMVRCENLSHDAITEALLRGDFYASTGITLKALQYDAEKGLLSVEVDPRPGVNYTIRFVGSPKDVSLDHALPDPVLDGKGTSHPVTGTYSDDRLGSVLKEVAGTKAAYRFAGNELYVRAVVSCDAGNLPVIDSGAIPAMAWTQPVGWEKYITGAE
jgi:hypothetical protein